MSSMPAGGEQTTPIRMRTRRCLPVAMAAPVSGDSSTPLQHCFAKGASVHDNSHHAGHRGYGEITSAAEPAPDGTRRWYVEWEVKKDGQRSRPISETAAGSKSITAPCRFDPATSGLCSSSPLSYHAACCACSIFPPFLCPIPAFPGLPSARIPPDPRARLRRPHFAHCLLCARACARRTPTVLIACYCPFACLPALL